MRKLASIQKVTDIREIPNADNIVCCTVLGWQVVCQKEQVKVGDLVVYVEVDSIIPDIDIFDYLKKITDNTMRIRTRRMRGQVSQGLVLPVSIVENFGLLPEDMIIGQDVTSAIGIAKYEEYLPAELMGKAKGYMPQGIPKSDIVRVQTTQEVLDKYKGTLCYKSEKLDGESITMYLIDGQDGVCSKIVDFIESDDSIHWKMAKKLNIKEKFMKLGYNISMQGEIIGEGIKGNKYKIKGQKVLFYNAFDINAHKYLNYKEFINLCQQLELEHVPIIDDNFILIDDINELVLQSNGRSMLYDTKREGIVVTPLEEINDMIGRIILKVISPEFLLKHGE